MSNYTSVSDHGLWQPTRAEESLSQRIASTATFRRMDALFEPSNRYRELRERRRPNAGDDGMPPLEYYLPDGIEQEVQLKASAVDAFANAEWSFNDLFKLAQNKLVWIGNAFLAVHNFDVNEEIHDSELELDFFLNITVRRIHDDNHCNILDICIWAPSAPQASAACNSVIGMLVSLFQAGESKYAIEVCSGSWWDEDEDQDPITLPVSGPALSSFVENTIGSSTLTLIGIKLCAEQCTPLVTNVGEDTRIELHECKLTPAGTRVLLDGILRNESPAVFIRCDIEVQVFMDALRGNSSVKSFHLHEGPLLGEQGAASVRALEDNLGLESLDFHGCPVDDCVWGALCESLATHPKIDFLGLVDTAPHDRGYPWALSQESKTQRTQCLVDLLKTNTVIKTINVSMGDRDSLLWEAEIKPRLELNKYRPFIRGLQRVEGLFREPLLGRALYEVSNLSDNNNGATLIYMLLVGTADIDWVERRSHRGAH